MSTEEFIRLAEVLKPYGFKGIAGAEHDVIYFNIDWEEVPESVRAQLLDDDGEFVGLHESEGGLACFV